MNDLILEWVDGQKVIREALPGELPEPVLPLLPDVQAAATASVNAAIGQVRARYITVLPGQEMLYLAKETEARAWLAAVDPDPGALRRDILRMTAARGRTSAS